MQGLQLKSLLFGNRGPYTFTIKSGQCVCLTGASGAGKSLLLRSIADLDEHEGEVFLNGVSASSMPAFEWRKEVGMLPAESRWWADLVGEHFKNPCAQVTKALGFPSDVMTWAVSRLSTGERQRLAIARLLEQQPKSLLLDEPTASLDIENIQRVESVLLDYQKRNTIPVLWVSHDLQQVTRVADKHLILTETGLSLSTGKPYDSTDSD